MLWTLTILFFSIQLFSQNRNAFTPGELWNDNGGKLINAHGGGMLFYNDVYYWFGEVKEANSNKAYVGVSCYSSVDLYNWKNEGTALSVSNDFNSLIQSGCIIERPKVIYNKKTKKFVMYFHLELKGMGYEAGFAGVAVSETIKGPYKFTNAGRVNAGYWPMNLSIENRRVQSVQEAQLKWWTPEWMNAINSGSFIRQFVYGGQMSRDMTLFVDDNDKAYHIYSSEENLTLHIAELTDDYKRHTGKFIRVDPGGHNEAPSIFKRKGKYYMITSGCTGWDPNAARLFVADSILGQWKRYANPCKGPQAEITFESQSTFVFPVQGKSDAFIFMADRWRPKNPIDGRYVWLPVRFHNDIPYIDFENKWNLDVFNKNL